MRRLPPRCKVKTTAVLLLLGLRVVAMLNRSSVTGPTTNITLGGLFSVGGPGSDWDGTAIFQAAELALQHVNEHRDVLSGYFLKIDTKNSKCRPGDGMKGFFELLYEEPTKLMILGASCSVVSQPVAETGQHWNLVQMSFSSASDVLSLKDRFPYFFRTNPTQSGLNTPRIALMKEYGWRRVAVIHDSSEYFTSAINTFSEDLAAVGFLLVAKESFHAGEKPRVQLLSIKNRDARIIVASAYEEGLQHVFCQAYRLNMYGPRYVWMIESWNSFDWWKNVTWTGCTNDEMYQVANNYVGTVFLDLRTDNNRTISGWTASQYKEACTERACGEPHSGFEFAPFGYDAVWAVALALDRVAAQLLGDNSTVRIEDFDYDNTNGLKEKFVEALSQLKFEGISGSVSFDASGNRLAPFKLEQLIDGKEEDVAVYSPERGLHWTRPGRLVFTGGAVPKDGPVQEIVYLGIQLSTFIVFAVSSVIGIITTLAFLVINIVYRNKRVIKLSCPKVNNIIAIGCLLCYLDVILAGMDLSIVSVETLDALCLVQVWILPIAFTLAFGGLFAKTWRVHVIFSNKTKRTRIFDYHLFGIIGGLVAIDVVIVLVWTVTDPIQLVHLNLPDQIDLEADKVFVRTLYKCDSPNSPSYLWNGIMFGWKGLLLLYGAFLAWETRKVTMSQLNDSKFIAIAIYNVAIPSIIIAPLVHLNTDSPEVSYVLAASCIIFGTTITSYLIFLPKIISLRQLDSGEVGGDDQRHYTTNTNQVQPLGSMSTHAENSDENKDAQITQLEQQLSEKEKIIQELTTMLKTEGQP